MMYRSLRSDIKNTAKEFGKRRKGKNKEYVCKIFYTRRIKKGGLLATASRKYMKYGQTRFQLGLWKVGR
jgi:hypothetical protein